MEMNEYQEQALTTSKRTKIGGDPLVYSVLGLNDEAGEVAGKLKKLYRDHGGKMTPEARLMFIKELGDVQWYIADIASALGVSLEMVAQVNLDKLASRQERGVIGGSGDER